MIQIEDTKVQVQNTGGRLRVLLAVSVAPSFVTGFGMGQLHSPIPPIAAGHLVTDSWNVTGFSEPVNQRD